MDVFYRYLIENLYISCFIFKAHALQNHPKSAVLFHNFKEDVECDVLIKQEESVSLQFYIFFLRTSGEMNRVLLDISFSKIIYWGDSRCEYYECSQLKGLAQCKDY